MNVLSLFDGMSCGQIALDKANINYDNYFASEIDKHAIKVCQTNYPKTIQLGDITQLNTNELPKIDLVLAGSPCQGFSSSGKLLNFEDHRSKLFFDFIRVLNQIKSINPDVKFIFENVNMKQEWIDIITEYIGIPPVFINSRLFSAQDRKRLYWTNILVDELPEDKGISFSDIAGTEWFCGSMRGRRIDPNTLTRKDYDKTIPIKQYIECRSDNKTNCLTTVQKDNVAVKYKAERRFYKDVEFRWLTPNEYEALQTVPLDYTACVSDNQRRNMLGNGWTVDVIVFLLKNFKKGD